MENPASLSCTENIALFHFLHAGRGNDGTLWRDSVPTLPSVAATKALPTNHKDYTLSLERERSLAGALAFISQIEDDPDHIPAVCVQEIHHPRENPALRVLLAVNKSKCNDGDSVLKRIRKDLEGIFEELSRVVDHDGDQLEIEHEIRRLIVSMCSGRILSRLRLTTIARRSAKQHPRLRFQNVIRALAVHNSATMTMSNGAIVSAEERDLFVERLREIVNLIGIYTNHPRPQQLEDLVDAFFRLRHVNCEALLSTIPDERIAESNRKSTLNMIQKVARYAEAARFLVRTSKKFPIARRMEVVAVHLPDTVFYRAPLIPEYSVKISSLLSRLEAPRSQNTANPHLQTDIICLLLGTTPDQANDDITKQTSRTCTTGKIHAEVQLILQYEIFRHSKQSNHIFLPSRIVSSSKKACFLCDLLIKTHGKMRTPWSHGKLYPGWRLPNHPGMDLQKQFHGALEDRIRVSIAQLFERRERTSYPGPSESTLITLPSLQSEPVILRVPNDEGRVGLSDIQDAESMAEDETDSTGTDVEDLQHNLGTRLSVETVRPVSEQASDETNAGIESEGVLQQAPVDVSRIMEKKHRGGSEKAERDAQQTDEGTGQDTQVAKDDLFAEDENSPDACNAAISSPRPGDQPLKSPKPCVDGVDSLDTYHHLKQGQRLAQTAHAEQMRTFFTRSLVVQVEYSTALNLEVGIGKQRRELPFSIERLGVDEIARLKDEGTLPIGNEGAVIGETPIVLPNMDHVYVAARGVVCKITFR